MRALPRAAPPRPAAAAARRPRPRPPARRVRSRPRTATRRRRARRPMPARSSRRPRGQRAPRRAPCSRRRARATAARSASRAARASASSSGGGEVASSPRRVCSTTTPWPTSGTKRSTGRRKPISASSPRRSRPQAASMTASSPRSPRLRRRVSTLPRTGSTTRSGRSASSSARRRMRRRPDPRAARHVAERAGAGRTRRRARRRAAGRRPSARLGMVLAGQVLGRVHRDVDAPVEQRLLDLAHEDAAAAELGEPAAPVAIAERRDRHDAPRPCPSARSAVARELGLRQREPRRRACRARWTSGSLIGQIEELAHRGGEVAPLAVDRAVPQADGRLVQQLAHDRAREPLDELAVALARATPSGRS